MKIVTKSGSVYDAVITAKGLLVQKLGGHETMAIAIYTDRLPFLADTVRIESRGKVHEGFNSRGVRTLRFVVDQVHPGMILANRRGFRSTEIVSVER